MEGPQLLSQEAPPREGDCVTGRKRKPESSAAPAGESGPPPRPPGCHPSAVDENLPRRLGEGLAVRRSLSNQMRGAGTGSNGNTTMSAEAARVAPSSSQGDAAMGSGVILQPHPNFEGIIDTPGGRFRIAPSCSQAYAALSQEDNEISGDDESEVVCVKNTAHASDLARASNDTPPSQEREQDSALGDEVGPEFWDAAIESESALVNMRTPSTSGDTGGGVRGGALVSQSPLHSESPSAQTAQNVRPSEETTRKLSERFQGGIDGAAESRHQTLSQDNSRNEVRGSIEYDDDDPDFWNEVIATTQTPSKSSTDSQVHGNISLTSQSSSHKLAKSSLSAASGTAFCSRESAQNDDRVSQPHVSQTPRRDDAHRTDINDDDWALARRGLWEKLQSNSSEVSLGLSQDDDNWSALFQTVVRALGISEDGLGISDDRSVSEICKYSICGASIRCRWRNNQTALSWVLSCATVPAVSADGVTIVIIPDEENDAIIKMVRMANERLSCGTLGIEMEPLICSAQSDGVSPAVGVSVKTGEKTLCKLIHEQLYTKKESLQSATPRIFVTNLHNLSHYKMRAQLERLVLKADGMSRFVVVEGLVEKSKHKADTEPTFQKQLLDFGAFIGPKESAFRRVPWTLLWCDSDDRGDFKQAFDSLAGVLNITKKFEAPSLQGNGSIDECSVSGTQITRS